MKLPELRPRLREPRQPNFSLPQLGHDTVGFAVDNLQSVIGTLGGKGNAARRGLCLDRQMICAHMLAFPTRDRALP